MADTIDGNGVFSVKATRNGAYFVNLKGTWDGATATLVWSPTGGNNTFTAIKDRNDNDVSRTNDFNGIVYASEGYLGFDMSSAGGSTDLDMTIRPIDT